MNDKNLKFSIVRFPELKEFWNKVNFLCDQLIDEFQKTNTFQAIELLEWIKNSDLEYKREIRRFNELIRIVDSMNTSRSHLLKIKKLVIELNNHIFSVFELKIS